MPINTFPSHKAHWRPLQKKPYKLAYRTPGVEPSLLAQLPHVLFEAAVTTSGSAPFTTSELFYSLGTLIREQSSVSSEGGWKKLQERMQDPEILDDKRRWFS
jgi:hypothetical protein